MLGGDSNSESVPGTAERRRSELCDEADELIADTSLMMEADAGRLRQEGSINTQSVLLVGVAFLCDFLLLTVIVPIMPSVFSGTSWGRPLVLAALFAAKPIAQILSNPAAGSLVGRCGSQRPLLIGCIVLILSSGGFALSLLGMDSKSKAGDVFWFCVGARAVQGVASALIGSAGMTLVVETHAAEQRGEAVGIASIGIALGALLGPPLGGILGSKLPWLPFAALSLLLFVNVLFQLCTLGMRGMGSRNPRQLVHSVSFSEDDEVGADNAGYDDYRYPVCIERHDKSAGAARGQSSSTAFNLGLETTLHSERPRQRMTTTCDLLHDQRILVIAAILTISNAAVGIIEALAPLYMQSTILCTPRTNGTVSSNISVLEHLEHEEMGGASGPSCAGDGEGQNTVLVTGLLFASSTLSYLVFTPLSGCASDRCANRADGLNRRWLIIFGGTINLGSAMSLFYLLGDSIGNGWPGVVGGLVGIGVGMALIEPPASALLADIIDAKGPQSDALGMVFSVQNSAVSLGFALGPLLGAFVESTLQGSAAGAGFRAMSLAFGVACVAFAPCLCTLRRTETMSSIDKGTRAATVNELESPNEYLRESLLTSSFQ
eukprot:g3864.t1